MSRKLTVLIALSLLLAVPAGIAQEDDADEGPADEATWGLCTAQDNYEDGDENSDGTVSSTPPFSSTSEEDCENAERPASEDAGDVPGPEDHADEEENPGDDGAEEADDGSDSQPEDPENSGEDNARDGGR